ncbi:MAG: hypothetical protein AAB869_03420 [Patescibacteria group bacterium]
MLVKLGATTRKRLIQDGYSLALEYNGSGVTRRWPNDPPSKKNRLVLVPYDPMSAREWFITSTRCITVGRELSGGPMGDRHGVVCAVNDDGERRSQFVLGGGKVQPDFDGTSADRLWPGEDCEFVRGAMVSENDEELRVPFASNWDPQRARDHKMWGARYFLFGVRAITDRIIDPATGVFTTLIKEEAGLPVGDACFVAITNERLGNFEGQKGETGARHLKPASELLRRITREERARGVLPMLPFAQATALALAIECGKEIWWKDMPPALGEIVADGEGEAKRVLENNAYAKHFTKVFQDGHWEV